MTWKTLAILAVVLAVSSAAHAKGIFQAEGTISELHRHADGITFRFVGKISFGYATAPDADPRRRWQDIDLEAADVSVLVGNWTLPFKPNEKADYPDTDRIFAKLAELTKAGHVVQFSLDNPGLSFSNVGQLVRVSGTFIYARDSDG